MKGRRKVSGTLEKLLNDSRIDKKKKEFRRASRDGPMEAERRSCRREQIRNPEA